MDFFQFSLPASWLAQRTGWDRLQASLYSAVPANPPTHPSHALTNFVQRPSGRYSYSTCTTTVYIQPAFKHTHNYSCSFKV